MKTIPVDYNATTPSGSLRLNFVDTREALAFMKAQVGDYVWASDGEVLVGARLDSDREYGLVATPRWRTLVNLDEYAFDNYFQEAFQKALQGSSDDTDGTRRAFQMLVTLDQFTLFDGKRALLTDNLTAAIAAALYNLEEFGLALSTLKDREGNVKKEELTSIYLDVLWEVDPIQAEAEAHQFAEGEDVSARVLAACISIAQLATDQIPDHDFDAASVPILEWIEKFDRAPGRDQIRAVVLAHVYFNLGLIMLRLGRRNEAEDAFNLAHTIDPDNPTIMEARALNSFDEEARRVAAKRRTKSLTSVA